MRHARGQAGGWGSGPGRLLTLALMALGWTAVGAEPSTFTILSGRSQIGYVSATQLGEFRGSTSRVTGDIVFDVRDPGRTRLSVSVAPVGLKSDNALRDRHMYEDLLEAGRFPAATFASTEFRLDGSDTAGIRGTLLGILTLHGVDRPVTVPVRFAVDGETLRGEGTLSVNLTDFAMTPPRLLGLKVRNEVVVEIRLVAASR